MILFPSDHTYIPYIQVIQGDSRVLCNGKNTNIFLMVNLLMVTSCNKCWKWITYAWTSICSFCLVGEDTYYFSIGKGKGIPLHAMKAPGGERRYSSYSFSTLAQDGGEWSASHPGRALPLGKDPWYPLDRRLGRPQNWSGRRG
jgi:hypothetical protein